MKIFLLTSKLNFKSAGGSVVDLDLKARGLAALGHDVTVITAFSYNNIITTEPPYKVTEETIPYRGLLGIQYRAYSILKKYENATDAFYIDGQIFVYGGGLYRLLGGKKPVTAFFNTWINRPDAPQGVVPPPLTSRKKLKKRIRLMIEHSIGVFLANCMDAFIFTTPMVQQLYLDWGFNKAKSNIIPDFVDMGSLTKKYAVTEKTIIAHQKNVDKVIVFSTGRMIPEKGFDLIIKAFALIQNKEKYKVILSGGGPDKERLESLVAALGLKEYFAFPGWLDRDALNQLILDAHVFIFPKWWIEYTSVLLMETFAFGLPCIIPRGGAIEWLTDYKAPTFKADDHKEMAMRVEELGMSENRRTEIALAMFKRQEALDYRILLKKMAEVILGTVKK